MKENLDRILELHYYLHYSIYRKNFNDRKQKDIIIIIIKRRTKQLPLEIGQL